jgi:hypothetical protein
MTKDEAHALLKTGDWFLESPTDEGKHQLWKWPPCSEIVLTIPARTAKALIAAGDLERDSVPCGDNWHIRDEA